MAYILPIEHYQYQDYQRRIVQDRVNRNYIEGPFKVILDRKHQEVVTRYKDLHPSTDNKVQSSTYNSEKMISQYTGKGRNFNDFA